MANHKSSLKRIRQEEKRRLHNRYYAKTMRNTVKKLRATTDKAEAVAMYPGVQKMLDKLAKTNIDVYKRQEQINVTQAKELELVPRVGEHIIFLGKPGNYEEKFEKLKTFYEKGLNQVGWNKYSRISLEFNNQIICTKKEK